MTVVCRVLLLIIVNIVYSIEIQDYPARLHSCKVSEVVENECVKCICTPKNTYKCTPKHCSKNKVVQSTKGNDSNNISQTPPCHPNTIYSDDTTTCICKSNGYWPHIHCEEIFQSLRNNTTESSCEPNTYVTIECNVCRCGPNGEIDKSRCTQNICDEEIEPLKINNLRRSITANNIYGSCEEKTWYSFAPCQFCYCVHRNKLVCNTGNRYSKKIDMGSYNLSVCGKDLIREAVELIPDDEKALRYGEINEKNPLPTMTNPKYASVSAYNEVVIDVNKKNEKSSDTNRNEKNNIYKDEYYSDIDGEKQEKKLINIKGKVGANNHISYQDEDDEDISKDNDEESDKKDESEDNGDNDLGFEIELPLSAATPELELTSKKPEQETSPKPETQKPDPLKNLGQNLGKSLKVNFPMMLDKMFRMALRKSMVSLSSDTKCEPGTTKMSKCNTCFCLKNSKLLCTNNVCE